MAKYKKYAENLIGDWETDIYEPQREIAQAGYQTNWNALTNSFNSLKDKLERNYNLARNEYTNTLNNVQNQSFNRMNNANIDLANRGLSSSGMLDLITQGDTRLKGQDVDKALSGLMNTTAGDVGTLEQGVMKYGEGQRDLAGDLGKSLGGITDADAKNNQQYAGLLAGIAESAAGRAASRGGGASRKAKKDQEEADELKRRMLIADTLDADDLTDQQKISYLTTYLDVPTDKAKAAVEAYGVNTRLDAATPEIQQLQSNIANLERRANKEPNLLKQALLQSSFPVAAPFLDNSRDNIFSITNSRLNTAKDNLNKLQNETRGLTYTDLYDLLYK